MKKIICIVLFIILACAVNVNAQTWYSTNQATIAWDAVAKIDPSDTVKYQVYLRIGTTGDGAPYGAELTATQTTISFSTEGSWFIGVRTLRYVTGEATPVPSATISWSNDAGVCSPQGPFGIKYHVAPGSPIGLKRVP